MFVSQQCLSNHIKKLEDQYHTALFDRYPKLHLTKSGEILYNSLRQIQILERNLNDQLLEADLGTNTIFRIGMHTWRAQSIIPFVLPKFQNIYPTIKVKIYSNVATEMEKMTLEGKLEVFIARGHNFDDRIKAIKLFDEPMFLCISDRLLQKYFEDDYPQCKEKFYTGIDIG